MSDEMNSAKLAWKELLDEMKECQICLNEFAGRSSMELVCHHVICKGCVERLKDDGMLTCPFCKRSHWFRAARKDKRAKLFLQVAQEKYRKLFETG